MALVVGHSQTKYLSEYLSKEQYSVFSFPGYTVNKLLGEDVIFEVVPYFSVVVIVIGANDIGRKTTSEIVAGIQHLCEAIHQHTPSVTADVKKLETENRTLKESLEQKETLTAEKESQLVASQLSNDRDRQVQCPYGPTNTYTIQTPLGNMTMTCCPKGLHTLGMTEEITDENFLPQPYEQVCLLSQLYQFNGYTYIPATQCLQWLQGYFNSKDSKKTAKPKICMHIGKEGSFTRQVWFTLLRNVPFGKTISYKSLAGLCGNEKACRAVGQAMSNNPVSIVIPCHRVIQEDGKLGNYSHGTRNKMKEWLLKHDGAWK